MDSDVVLPSGWIEKALNILEKNKSLGGVGGPGISYKKNVISESLDLLLFGITQERGFVDSIATMDVVYKREAIKGLYFDEELFAGEDPEFNLRLRKRGYKLYFDKKLWVYHYHPLKLFSLLKKWYNYGKSRPLLAKKHKEFRNLGFYLRLLYIPLMVVFGLISIVMPVFVYFLALQFLLLFGFYFFIGLKRCRGVMVLVFPSVHTFKQLAHMFGYVVGIRYLIK